MKKIIILIFAISLFVSCGGGDEFRKSPLDELIRDLNKEPTYTIVLYDIDVDGTFMRTYKQIGRAHV